MSIQEGIPFVKYREKWEDKKHDYGIGIIGVGNVARWGHLNAYRMAGLNVVAAADVSEEAREVAKKYFGIEKVYSDYRELLDLKEVEVVDVTIHHRFDDLKLEITKEAGDRGKPVLLHKPLARTYELAKEIVQAAKDKGIKLAVNQNGRWGPAHFAARELVREGFIGNPLVMMVENIAPGAWPSEPLDAPCFSILEWSIHHYDVMRWILGKEPVEVESSMFNRSNLSIVYFEGNTQGSLVETVLPQGGADQNSYKFRVEGEKGTIRGRQGWHSFLKMPPDQLFTYSELTPRNLDWLELKLPPDPIGHGYVKPPLFDLSAPWAGFVGSICELMDAITENREPVHSGEDNLKTLQLMFAAYKSAKEGRKVSISEIS